MTERFLRDVRYALRVLRLNPGFAAVAILVLSLGIGVNTACFGLVDALLFKPLPVPEPERLVRLAATATDGALTYADLLDYRASARTLSGLCGFTGDRLEYRAEGATASAPVGAYFVTDDYFEVLGVELSLGRGLAASPDPGAPPGVVLSDAFWRTSFAADPRVVGRSLWLDGASFTVRGVAPRQFTGTLRGGGPQVFVPYTSQVPPETLRMRDRNALIAVGRLAPGVTVEAAQAEISVLGRRLAVAYPETNRGVFVTVGPERTALFREAPGLAVAVAAVYGMFGLFLVLACVNLAGLLTARATFREKEIAMRATLGASRQVLVAQLLTESLVLAVLGGAGGLLVGAAARSLLWSRLQTALAAQMGFELLSIDTQADLRIVFFTLALALGSILIFGLAPALHAAKQDLFSSAKDDSASPPPVHLLRLRRLVAAQVMLSVVLLSCAGLLLQTVRNAASSDNGYPLDRVYVADLDLSRAGKGNAQAAFDRIVSEVSRMPGVEAAAIGANSGPAYLPQGATPGRPRQNYVRAWAGPGMFATMRIPMRGGREFSSRDVRGAPPVAILNQKLAEALWPGQDPIGRQLVVREDQPAVTVVGLTKSVRTYPVGPPFFMLYRPLAQEDLLRTTLLVRAAPGRGDEVQRRLPGELRGLVPELSSVRVRPLADWFASVLALPRAAVDALSVLGGVALFLAAVGLYGVTAYVARRRSRECALRSVLGASRFSIFRLLVGNAMRTVCLGLGLGLGLSLLVGWLLKSALLGAAFDPIALVAAPVALAVTAFAAVAWPVLRAASLDPMRVLREE